MLIIGIIVSIIIIYYLGYDMAHILSQIARMTSDEVSEITLDTELFWKIIGALITIFVALVFYKMSGARARYLRRYSMLVQSADMGGTFRDV